jgi:hypothetical protein
MAAITDLTFAQIQAELPANTITYNSGTQDVLISMKALTGDNFTGLTNDGVCEAIYKLVRACQLAQAEVNADPDLEDGETLLSFPAQSTGSFDPSTNQVEVRSVIAIALNVDPNFITGVNS